ncbi:MAG: hypothetical protein ACLTOO_12690 [Oscillospiraceae bacterium]
MSILTGFKKVKDYILTSSGYQLLSRWTSSQTVEFDDGKTAQTKLGEINGIAKTYVDMKKATDNSMAVSAKAVMEGLENSSALISMTQEEYDALSDEEKTDNNMRAILDANPDVVDAKNVNFDNANTNLTATNTQSAITELNGKLGNIYISDITSEINTDYVDGSVYVYSTNRTIRVIAKLTAKEDIPAWTHIINNLGWSGINIYFHDVNNQIGINWNGNYMQNTIVVSKNNTFNIDIEGIV